MIAAAAEATGDRPPVTVVVPFLGSDVQLRGLVQRLQGLRRRPGDELIVADNRSVGDGHGASVDSGGVIVHSAGGVRSPGFARNRGAARASGEWLVFIDADTEPDPDLLDAYFRPAVTEEVAILAGRILDIAAPDPRTGSLTAAARHAAARGHMEDRMTLERPVFPYAQTANCAVRREAFVQVGGFAEEVRAGEDADLCFRLEAGGWRLDRRPAAIVRHRTRATLRSSLIQLSRHGAGAAWCNDRHPGSFPAPGPRSLGARIARSAAEGVGASLRRDREAATFAALDIAEGLAFELGRLRSNRAGR